jgi:hypothetical protein
MQLENSAVGTITICGIQKSGLIAQTDLSEQTAFVDL